MQCDLIWNNYLNFSFSLPRTYFYKNEPNYLIACPRGHSEATGPHSQTKSLRSRVAHSRPESMCGQAEPGAMFSGYWRTLFCYHSRGEWQWDLYWIRESTASAPRPLGAARPMLARSAWRDRWWWALPRSMKTAVSSALSESLSELARCWLFSLFLVQLQMVA